MQEPIKVTVCGAAGKMGRLAVESISQAGDLVLAGAVDPAAVGRDAGEAAGLDSLGVMITADLDGLLARGDSTVMVDFTGPLALMDNIRAALTRGVVPVVGTTGITESDLEQVRRWVEREGGGAIIVPNFALGAVLLIKMAQLCARYFPAAEIIEQHHDRKVDAPSGTALRTAQLIREARHDRPHIPDALEKLPGARGGDYDGIRIHSVRLPGAVAHQEVIFGGEGQLLTLRHDALDRRSFLPGLLAAIRRAPTVKGLIYGIEDLLEL